MSNRLTVRLIGALLLILAAPCLWWSGWFFKTLFALLAISGIWRLCFPENSIRTQQKSYPRWVHGLLMLCGAIAIWTLKP